MSYIGSDLVRGQTQFEERLVQRPDLDEDSLKRIIREMGLKVTHQRLAILTALNVGRAHVTAQEVFDQVNKERPEIGFATVYRFLRKMTECKLVSEVRMGGLPARYELSPQQHHDHLRRSSGIPSQAAQREPPGLARARGVRRRAGHESVASVKTCDDRRERRARYGGGALQVALY